MQRQRWGGRRHVAVALGVPFAALLAISACSSGGSSNSGSTAPSSAAHTSAAASGGGATTIGASSGPNGTYLTGASGKTVYLWEADKTSKSTCSSTCAAAWPPVTTKGAPKAAGSVKAGELGTTKRSGGATQVTYDGHPLYYYSGDTGAGSASGEGSDQFGAKWWQVAPSGSAITGASTSKSSAPSTGSSSSSSSHGSSWG